MNSETLSYISRRMRRENTEHQSSEPSQDREYYPEYEDRRISNRYNSSTNTYRAEGVVEGHIEHHGHDERHEDVKRQIGFNSGESKGHKDFIYEMEESLEKEIDDVVYYSELAMEAETKGHTEFSEGFYEIAKEKLSCAESIRHRLIKCRAYDPYKQSEIEDRFDRAKHLFRRL